MGRIDYILVSDKSGTAELRSHEILRDGGQEAGKYPSDHYTVLAVLALTD